MTTTVHPNDLEEFAMGELGGTRCEQIRAHLEACPSCARECDALAEDARLFANRAARVNTPVADFAPVARALEERRNRSWFARFGVSAGSVAAFLFVFQVGAGPALVASAEDEGEVCGPTLLAVSWCAHDDPTGEEVAMTEDEFRACLIASPG